MKLAEARALAVGTVIHECYRRDGVLYPSDRSATFEGVEMNGTGKSIKARFTSEYWRWEPPICWFPADHPDLAKAHQNDADRTARNNAYEAARRARWNALDALKAQFGAMVLELDGDTVKVRIPTDRLEAVAAVLTGGAP